MSFIPIIFHSKDVRICAFYALEAISRIRDKWQVVSQACGFNLVRGPAFLFLDKVLRYILEKEDTELTFDLADTFLSFFAFNVSVQGTQLLTANNFIPLFVTTIANAPATSGKLVAKLVSIVDNLVSHWNGFAQFRAVDGVTVLVEKLKVCSILYDACIIIS